MNMNKYNDQWHHPPGVHRVRRPGGLSMDENGETQYGATNLRLCSQIPSSFLRLRRPG